MKNIRNVVIIALSIIINLQVSAQFQAEYKSLEEHKNAPEWFKDAKFGIYTHWTPTTIGNELVPCGWYPYYMYQKDSALTHDGQKRSDGPHWAYTAHVNHYGDPKTFGWKDVVKTFQPQEFNAEEWAELFYQAGAKFAGPVAMHHDGFAMWDSEVTRWCAGKNSGFDPSAGLEKEIRKRGMNYIASFHHGKTWQYYVPSYAYDGSEPAYRDLYFEPHAYNDPMSENYKKWWRDVLDEYIEKYDPDMIWFDMGESKVPNETMYSFLASYYESGKQAKRELATTCKNYAKYLPGSIIDYEKGRVKDIQENPWLTDDTMAPQWFNSNRKPSKTANDIIDMLADIVSKNGCLLLNVAPDSNGKISDYEKDVLLKVGQWLTINGEAIYSTRPWHTAGEGPTELDSDGSFIKKKLIYTAKDIRYTRSKDDKALYAIVLSTPTEDVILSSISTKEKIKKISLLGYKGKLKWQQSSQGLRIEIPEDITKAEAYTFKMKH